MSSSSSSLSSLELSHLTRLAQSALDEDVSTGDVTTQATIPASSQSTAKFLAKSSGILSGLSCATFLFHYIDSTLEVNFSHSDGDRVTAGTVFGTVNGSTRSLLIAERLVLNLMQRMSGIATLTSLFVSEVSKVHSSTRILDTRKTVPGLRLFDKMAVRHGGGMNHRIGLYDMIMIKDNHITASGGIKQAILAVKVFLKEQNKENLPIEVETRTLEEVEEAVKEGGVQRLMLDNMVTINEDGLVDCSKLESALKIINGKFESEASGNVTLKTVGEIAKTGVNFISTGAVTHSVTALDISLKIQ
jgi:nicotinate-nucleotide pyrophosphorylase (carboxylating)